MMRLVMTIGTVGLAAVTWQMAACNLIPVTVDVPLQLGNPTFEVVAGVPTGKTILFGAQSDFPFSPGRGTLEFDPTNFTIVRGSGKARATTQQVTGLCSEQAASLVAACTDAGTDSAACADQGVQSLASCLSDAGQIEIRTWVSAFDATVPACESGDGVDTYGPYVIELDDSDNVVSISGSPRTLQPDTLTWLDTVGARVCIQVVAGFTGQVIINEFSLSLGL